jgi:hypothetical protein
VKVGYVLPIKFSIGDAVVWLQNGAQVNNNMGQKMDGR